MLQAFNKWKRIHGPFVLWHSFDGINPAIVSSPLQDEACKQEGLREAQTKTSTTKSSFSPKTKFKTCTHIQCLYSKSLDSHRWIFFSPFSCLTGHLLWQGEAERRQKLKLSEKSLLCSCSVIDTKAADHFFFFFFFLKVKWLWIVYLVLLYAE